MAAIGGDIKSVSINGRAFPVAKDNDPGVELGYNSAEVVSNGDGSARKITKSMPWGVEGVEIVIDHARGDLEFVGTVRELSDNVPVSIIFADGSQWAGEGTITGDGKYQAGSATMTVDLMGGGKLRNVT